MRTRLRLKFYTRQLLTIVSMLLVVVFANLPMDAQAITRSSLDAIVQGYSHYNPMATAGCTPTTSPIAALTTASFVPTGPGSTTADGHHLPAVVGGTGIEAPARREGRIGVVTEGSDKGKHLAVQPEGLTDNDVRYYMNMRWRYVEWTWRGPNDAKNPENKSWYESAVRKVLITYTGDKNNPDDDISVVGSIVDAGPAPWTGTGLSSSEVPSYWQGSIDGTPPEYKGRVSGLAPDLFYALAGTTNKAEAEARIERFPGKGADVYYQWAPDQNVAAGTKYVGSMPSGAASVAELSSGKTLSCSGNGLSGSFVFYSQYDPKWINHCYGGQNKDGSCTYSTVGEGGCGPSSMAMVISTFGQKQTPDQVADYSTSQHWYIPGNGSSWDLFKYGPKHWGLQSQFIGTNLDQAISALKNGALVIASGTGPSPYTGFVDANGPHGGHIITLRGVTADGRILIGDSNVKPPPEKAANNINSFTQANIRQGLKGLWIITKGAN